MFCVNAQYKVAFYNFFCYMDYHITMAFGHYANKLAYAPHLLL